MTRSQRLTLAAAILGSARGLDRRDDRQRRAPVDRARSRRRALGAAVGLERLPARARLADPDRRLARRHLRRAARLRDGRRRCSACSRSRPRSRPTIDFLIAARALQGAAAALLTPSSLAIIVAAFHEKERGPAIGTWLAWGTVAGIVGPLAGGLIVDQLDWRWVFALNVPLVVGDARADPRRGAALDAPVTGRRVDYVGALALHARARRRRVRADRAAALRLEQRRDARPARRRASPRSRPSSPTSAARRSRC